MKMSDGGENDEDDAVIFYGFAQNFAENCESMNIPCIPTLHMIKDRN